MDYFRVENIRSIVDSGDIAISPITVLIGKNSSGKSTFLRSIPLLKQSLLCKRANMILWYGEYVDFGSFPAALTTYENEKGDKRAISFSFAFGPESTREFIEKEIELPDLGEWDGSNMRVRFSVHEKWMESCSILIGNNNHHLEILLSRIKNPSKSYRYSIQIGGKETGLIVEHPRMTYKGLIPSAFCLPATERDNNTVPAETRTSRAAALLRRGLFLLMRSIDSADEAFAVLMGEQVTSVVEKCREGGLVPENIGYDEVFRRLRTDMLGIFLGVVDDYLLDQIGGSRYFKPLRASGARFYRITGLDVQEINSDGSNAGMVLYAMQPSKRKDFEKWCLAHFGFAYSVESGHNSSEMTQIFVLEKKNGKMMRINMTDAGFGYSQLLPLVLAAYMTENDRSAQFSPLFRTLLIEQPELHLHPAMQRKFIRTALKVVNVCRKKKIRVRFVLETHSATIINYLGELVYQGELRSEDVNIVIANKTDQGTQFDQTSFDQTGLIQNWPIGFFSDDD